MRSTDAGIRASVRALTRILGAASLLLASACEDDPFALPDDHLSPQLPSPVDAAVREPSDAALPQVRDAAAYEASVTKFTVAHATYCEVQPLIARYCTSCHVEGGVGPMPLVTPEQFHLPSASDPTKLAHQLVRDRVHDTARPMPPPPKQMSEFERALLDAWLRAGAPGPAEACDAPKPKIDDGWDPSKCDTIYELRAYGGSDKTQPFVVPARSEIGPQIAHDAPWGNEKVQAIAFRPITDNKRVLHHWILYGKGRVFLTGWAPGDDVRPPFPADVGMDMPTGAGVFTLDMHYYNAAPDAIDEPDRSGLEICVLKEGHFRPKLAAVATTLFSPGNALVLAPRFSYNTPSTGICNVVASQPVHFLTAGPHAHKYAVRMVFKVQKKSGDVIVMHDEPWAFGEQGTYPLSGGEVMVESGDVITTSCYYTNPTSIDIRFGESTESEMCFNFAQYYPKGSFSCR